VPKTLSEFYRYAIFVIYAVVVGQSFSQVTLVFIPFEKLLNFTGFLTAFMLLFIYFFIISSWIGYFKSTSVRPHSENKFGLIRFGIDLIIIYEFYYLVNISTKPSNYSDIFIYIFPFIFITFSIWDILKHLEFKIENQKEKEDRRNRFIVTLVFLSLFIISSLAYSNIVILQPLLYYGNNVWDIIFILISWILVGYYRYKKWNITLTRHRRRKSNKI
jgi:hypothetical protein